MDADSPVLVGVDGSAESRNALEWAADLAALTGAVVVAVHAMGLLERLGPSGDWLSTAGHQGEIERVLQEDWCECLRQREVRYRTELAYGPPADLLLATARRLGASLVVVGSRGAGRVPIGELGSCSLRLARQSDIPLVIVPYPAR